MNVLQSQVLVVATKSLVFFILGALMATHLYALNLCEVHFGGTYIDKMSFGQRVVRSIPGLRNIPGVKSKKWSNDLSYDHELFLKVKNDLLENEFNLSQFYDQPIPLEVMLASLEIVSSMQNNGLESVEHILKHGTPKQKKKLNEQIRFVLQSPHFSRATGDRLIEALYVIANPALRNRWRSLRGWRPFRKVMKRHIEMQVAKGDLERVFERLGILNSNKRLEDVARYIQLNEAKLTWIATISASTGIYFLTKYYVGQGFIVPVYMPPLNLMGLIKERSFDLDMVRAVGYEDYISQYYLPENILGKLAHVSAYTIDEIYGMLRGVTMLGIKTFLAYAIITNWETMGFMLGHNQYLTEYALLFAQGGFENIANSVQEVSDTIEACATRLGDECSAEMVDQIKDFVFSRSYVVKPN